MKKYSLLDNIIHRMVFIENWTVQKKISVNLKTGEKI